ncbi:patatin-like phospholipase family protein [Sphingomonas profundi]|uniref:patatin-like phospholipase family protein n=1 Tax=Alterirhizorhabdus profundi TaxID=2681549 RepID=UPI0018D0761A|nr:patatin-like phospholipase family protein [Sphingomonas profundi]
MPSEPPRQPSETDPAIRAADDLDRDALASRRAALEAARAGVSGWSGTGIAGLALSGGGIRSATLSLGMLQAIAGRRLIGHFDYVSAVSGGGYIAGFFRSLFLPGSMRGAGWQEAVGTAPGVSEQHRFAEAVLASEPADRTLAGPDGAAVRNPIWWLRQHSRYLAPNGPSDYASAASYLTRNWIAMLYVFVIAVASIFAGVTLLLRALFHLAGADPLVARLTAIRLPAAAAPPLCPGRCPPAAPPVETVLHLSPWLPLAALAVVAAFCCGVAYWMTENMQATPQPLGRPRRLDDRTDSRRRFLRVTVPTMLLAAAAGTLVILYDVSAIPPLRRTAGSPAIWVIGLGAAYVLATGLVAIAAYLKARGRFANPTAEMRRLLTAWLTAANLAALVLVTAGICDSLALALRTRVPAVMGGGVGPLVSTVLIPAAAFAINRLSGLLGGKAKGGGIAGFLARHMSVALLIAGTLLYGIVAILVDAAVQAVLWSGTAWGPPGLDGRPTATLLLILVVLVGMTGRAHGFINLSSLHQLYAARLTRAYLGASNLARLRLDDGARTIKEGDPCDHVEPRAFFAGAVTAPIPLLLTTLNETISPQSQLTERDRKGVPLLLGPQGISVDRGAPIRWSDLAASDAEALSMGQWCAISGAAASAGMGRLTTLGGALTCTFANVRLGYWWRHGGTIAPCVARPLTDRLGSRFDTFLFLFAEMTARYSRNWRRVYLSDGGHFENSAAYALLHRRVGVVLLCDGGEDPLYRFDDLEQLVRKVRLDLRGEVEPVEWATVEQVAGGAAPFFLNAQGAGGWHERIDDPASAGAFALMLRARFAGETQSSIIVWLKPRRLPTMAADVAAYARFNPAFPHQSTGDQFFDEAQWESYRKLGFQMADALLEAAGPAFLDRLRAASGR